MTSQIRQSARLVGVARPYYGPDETLSSDSRSISSSLRDAPSLSDNDDLDDFVPSYDQEDTESSDTESEHAHVALSTSLSDQDNAQVAGTNQSQLLFQALDSALEASSMGLLSTNADHDQSPKDDNSMTPLVTVPTPDHTPQTRQQRYASGKIIWGLDEVICPECGTRQVRRTIIRHIRIVHPLSAFLDQKDPKGRGVLQQAKQQLQKAEPRLRKVANTRTGKRGSKSQPLAHKCNDCDKQFKTWGYLHNHLHKSHGKKVYKARDYSTLPAHTPFVVQCPDCGSRLSTFIGLRRHFRTRHPDSTFFTSPADSIIAGRGCPYCPAQFVNASSTRRHVKVNHADKPRLISGSKSQRWFKVIDSTGGTVVLFPCLSHEQGAVREPTIPRARPPTRPENVTADSSVLRLRGGAASHTCPICDDEYRGTTEQHFHSKHAGTRVDSTILTDIQHVMCECGAIITERGFGAHSRICATAKVMRGTVVISSGRNRVRPNTHQAYEPSAHPGPSGTATSDPDNRTGLPETNGEQSLNNLPVSTAASFTFEQWPEMILRPTYLKLVPRGIVQPFIECCVQAIATYDLEPKVCLIRFLLIPKLALAPGMRLHNAAVWLSNHPNNAIPDIIQPTATSTDPTEQAIRLVEMGRLGLAMQTLAGTSIVVKATSDVMRALRDKIVPYRPRGDRIDVLNMGPITIYPDEDDLDSALRSFKVEVAPGPSGWTVLLLRLAWRDERIKRFLVDLTKGLLDGTAQGWEFLCASRLTPLKKKDGGIRPIAVSDLIYRLCTKTIIRKYFKTEMLAPFQFGVGTKGGVEPIIHLVKMVLRDAFPHDFKFIVKIDGSNSYNAASRDMERRAVLKYAPVFLPLFDGAYGFTAALIIKGENGVEVLDSSEGVRQGCPTSSFFYSVGVRDELQAVVDALGPSHILLSFIDDDIILSPNDSALSTYQRILKDRDSPTILNPAKCKVLAIEDVRRNGTEILGTWVGPSEVQVEQLDKHQEELDNGIELALRLPHQHAMLVLRSCVIPKARHLLRTLDPETTKEAWAKLDTTVRYAVSVLRWSGAETGEPGDLINRRTITLPISMGGMGMLSFADCSPHAYLASTRLSESVLSDIVQAIAVPSQTPTQRQLCQAMFEEQRLELYRMISEESRILLWDAASAIGRRWMVTIPTWTHLRLSDLEVAMNLQRMSLLSPTTNVCHACGRANPDLHHSESCQGLQVYRTLRHGDTQRAWWRGLNTVPQGRATMEPFVRGRDPGTARYNDVRFEGSIQAGLGPAEWEIKVPSLTAQRHNTAPRRAIQDAENPVRETELRVNHTLESVRQIAENNLNMETIAGAKFEGFVMSSGGRTEVGTQRTIDKVSSKMPPGAPGAMTQEMSIQLARRRAAARAHLEGHHGTSGFSSRH